MPDQSLGTPPADPAAGDPAPGSAEGADATPVEGAPAAPQGTSDAIAAARERLADGKPILEGPTPAEGEGEGEGAPAEGDKPELTAEETAAAKAVADAEAAKGAEGAEGAEGGEGAEGAEGAEKTAPETFLVSIPGVAERGEEAIELETPDKEVYERINRLKNGYMAGQAVKAGVDENRQKAAELVEVEDAIQIDPTGFVLDHIPENLRPEIAMQLLFEGSVLNQVKENLAAGENPTSLAEILESPDALRITQAELKAGRMELREKLRTHNDEQKAMRANGEAIAAEVMKLIPEEITGERHKRIFDDAMRDIKDRCDRLGLKKFDPQDVKLIVADRFRQLGIDFAKPRTDGDGKPVTPATPAPGKPAGAAAGAERTGAELVQARTTRRAAAASAPAGAGAPAAPSRPELPDTTDERIALAKKKGLRYLLGRS